jgi:hypothetical protein
LEFLVQTYVKIKVGTYRNKSVAGQIFPLVKQFAQGKKGGYVTVLNGGAFPDCSDTIKIKVGGPANYAFASEVDYVAQGRKAPATLNNGVVEAESNETDAQIMARIKKRFEILTEMTNAAISGDIRAMIVTGPPGVGKSFGIEKQCENASLFDVIANRRLRYEIMKGATTAVGLYCTLYKMSDPNHVLVLDDCDSVFTDETSLNILKAALDSGKRRRIHWNADSNTLRQAGVPDQFDFKGSVIFITNYNMDAQRPGKMKDQMMALQSRCHYMDLSINTMRDRCLRVKQVFLDGELFKNHDLDPKVEHEIIDFMIANKNSLREVSLRMAQKIADLVKVNGSTWKDLARETCMRQGTV